VYWIIPTNDRCDYSEGFVDDFRNFVSEEKVCTVISHISSSSSDGQSEADTARSRLTIDSPVSSILLRSQSSISASHK